MRNAEFGMRSESLDARGPAGLLLRVEFTLRGDRYGHVISAVSAGGSEVLLQSIEGTPADDWPPSPPLVNLHRETLPNGRTALLLVGAAGRSHWSASIEAVPNEAKLVFDLACRPGERPLRLGNEYLAAPLAMKRLDMELDDAQILGNEQQFRVVPRGWSESSTNRWKFSICLRS